MRYSAVILFLLMLTRGFAQWTPSVLMFDTVKLDHRTGCSLDSLDVFFRSLSSSPISDADLNSGVVPVNFFSSQHNGLIHSRLDPRQNKMRYSGLPHIGFAYGFGAGGIQTAKMSYEQVFAKKIMVNLDYTSDRANGLTRNSMHKLNDLSLRVINRSRFYTFLIGIDDRKLERGLNGGIGEAANVVDFPLIFQPVNKVDAQENIRWTRFSLENYLSLFSRDSVLRTGLFSAHDLSVRGRVFTESGNLSDLYDSIYIDPFSTRDTYQWSSTSHHAGYFFRSDRIFASVAGAGSYWKYFNLGNEIDTLEFGIHEKLSFRLNKLSLDHIGKINVIGAGREWELITKANYSTEKFFWKSELRLASLWPDVTIRSYNSNHHKYVLSEYERQFGGQLKNEISFTGWKIPLIFLQESSILRDNYFWNGANWQNDLYPVVDVHSVSFSTSYSTKGFNVQPRYTFSYNNAPILLRPEHLANLRVFVKGGLFKGKKPLAYLGADLLWQSGFGLLDLIPNVGVYSFDVNTDVQKGYLNLHVFGGLQIDEFRFYLRFENIGYFWSDREIQVLKGYTIPSGILRLGLTWDFFN